MPTGLIVSVIGHAMLLLWGIVSLPSSSSLDLSNFEAVPVDFVPIDELTRLNLGVTTAEAREEIVPEPPAPEIAELPPEPEPMPEPELAPEPPEPEPLPEPEVAEPEPLPPPEPPAAEPPPPEPEAVPEPAVAPEPAPPPPPEEKVAEPEPEPPPPVPRARPKPPAPKKTVVAKAEPKETFNPDEISALLDKSQPTGSTRTDPTPPTLGSSTGSVTQEMTLNEIDALRARLAQCWNIQLAPPDPSELRVKLKMFLNPDGSISQAPQVLEVGSSEFARSAAESAVRAVRRCAPYNLPAEKYDSWREINVTFDPREMFGGG
jgi:hypothetical protein